MSSLYLSICFFRTHQLSLSFFFFFNDTATTEIYTLSLHDALPISGFAAGTSVKDGKFAEGPKRNLATIRFRTPEANCREIRSEEHTSELQSLTNLVCRLLLEKKKKKTCTAYHTYA